MLNIHLKSLPLMRSDHREIATANGILQIAIVATNPLHTVSDNESIEITKELAFRLLEQLSEFGHLLALVKDDNKQEISTTDDINKVISKKLSNIGHDATRHLKLAIELILTEQPDHILTQKAIWNTLVTTKEPNRYKIKTIYGSGATCKIEFQCGHTTNYHAAQFHIKKIIKWHKSTNTKK